MVITRSQLKNKRGKFFLTHGYLNHGPLELKTSVLLMSYAVSFGARKIENEAYPEFYWLL